ncbi:MAG: hypothetical protein HC842_02070 [Cytophagales bacterium]|nr:hypothetical protein [Cytophagales bacterium]
MGRVFQIAVKVSDGGYNLISVNDFLKMPMMERMEMMLQKRIQYLDEVGNVIPILEATRQMGEVKREAGLIRATAAA